MSWDIEAPNVVTEARFRELVESGYSAEILCQESAHKKGPSYYGVWVMRAVLNRPGFTGEFFVQNLGGIIKGVHVCIEGVLHFLRRSMADGAM
jgi:hypothetical protein